MTESGSTELNELLTAIPDAEITPMGNGGTIAVFSHGPNMKNAVAEGKMEKFLREFSGFYRDIYGGAPWNEYLVCTKKCGGKTAMPPGMTLDSADKKFLEEPREFCCKDCGAPMEFFYPPEITVNNLREAFRQKIFASLLFDEEQKFAGFHLGWETTVGEGYRDKMIIGTGDPPEPNMSYEEYLEELKTILGHEYGEDSKAYNAAEWGVARNLRGSKYSLPLLRCAFESARKKISSHEDVPVIAHTLMGSKAFDLVRKIGWATGVCRQDSKEIRLYSTLPQLIEGIKKYTS